MKLYKYLPLSTRTLEGLEKSQLWFADPNSFNDPFDCNLDEVDAYSKQDIEAFFARITAEDKIKKNVTQYGFKNPDKIRENVLKHRTNNFTKSGVLCLLKNHDNLLMWAHYADSHKGIVLGFEIAKDKDFFTHMFEVEYQDEYEPINYAKNGVLAIESLFQTKSAHWSYEEEIRIIKTPSKINKNNNSRLFSYKKETLTDIYFGLKASDEYIKKTQDIFVNKAAFPINFHKARKVPNEFKLSFDLIS